MHFHWQLYWRCNVISSCTACLSWCYCASKIYLAMAQLLQYKCYAKCREEAIISTAENFQKYRTFLPTYTQLSHWAKPLRVISAISVPSFNHSFSKNVNGYKMIKLGWSHNLQYGISLAIRAGRRNHEIKMVTCTLKKLSPIVNVKLSVAPRQINASGRLPSTAPPLYGWNIADTAENIIQSINSSIAQCLHICDN